VLKKVRPLRLKERNGEKIQTNQGTHKAEVQKCQEASKKGNLRQGSIGAIGKKPITTGAKTDRGGKTRQAQGSLLFGKKKASEKE